MTANQQSIYDYMAIPESCNLGKRVFKKLSQENAKIGGTDKMAFREDFAFEARLIHMQPWVSWN